MANKNGKDRKEGAPREQELFQSPRNGRKEPGGGVNGRRLKDREKEKVEKLNPDTKKSIWGMIFLGISLLLFLAWANLAGSAGRAIYDLLHQTLGVGYFILPTTLLFVAGIFLISHNKRFVGITMTGGLFIVLSVLGIIHVVSPGSAGWLGYALGSLNIPFDQVGGFVLNAIILAVSILVTTNTSIRISMPKLWGKTEKKKNEEVAITGVSEEGDEDEESVLEEVAKPEAEPKKEEKKVSEPEIVEAMSAMPSGKALVSRPFKNYVPPPLDLLKSTVEKPTTGDLRGNANIIKRTLESFGVTVEMGEINIGPKFTRYTLKPAEGMKLSRITALNSDLALALAAHPIRIEAPIPGKSLVGIEVPNKSAAMVRLGSLLAYPEFQTKPLSFALGRDVNGEPMFANIEKMPHMLVAGATGSGKSILVHSLILSLLYKNSPANLKMVMIDPKRVELTMYNGLPHLALPVVTETKKALAVFRWAISEMERRYVLFESQGRRDIQSYNGKNPEEPLPYIVVIVDEMADLMTQYGKEVEGSIIRLAQMARATGIHLVLATQRPSVEIITGLIKANITNRIALQVASGIDSRTILDTTGAEKLLGGGDLLFISQELSQPRRIQGAYVSEDEITAVTNFIRKHNEVVDEAIAIEDQTNGNTAGSAPLMSGVEVLDEFMDGDDDDDEMYDEAVAEVAMAKKASASLLQRRLKIGYARAARLLDLMEKRGIIGPGDGAKPREVYLDRLPHQTQ